MKEYREFLRKLRISKIVFVSIDFCLFRFIFLFLFLKNNLLQFPIVFIRKVSIFNILHSSYRFLSLILRFVLFKNGFLIVGILFYHSTLFSQKPIRIEIVILDETGNHAVSNTPVVFQEIGKYLITSGEGSIKVNFPSPGSYNLRIMTSERFLKKHIRGTRRPEKIYFYS